CSVEKSPRLKIYIEHSSPTLEKVIREATLFSGRIRREDVVAFCEAVLGPEPSAWSSIDRMHMCHVFRIPYTTKPPEMTIYMPLDRFRDAPDRVLRVLQKFNVRQDVYQNLLTQCRISMETQRDWMHNWISFKRDPNLEPIITVYTSDFTNL